MNKLAERESKLVFSGGRALIQESTRGSEDGFAYSTRNGELQQLAGRTWADHVITHVMFLYSLTYANLIVAFGLLFKAGRTHIIVCPFQTRRHKTFCRVIWALLSGLSGDSHIVYTRKSQIVIPFLLFPPFLRQAAKSLATSITPSTASSPPAQWTTTWPGSRTSTHTPEGWKE